jgi:hypothetical protein
MSQYRAIRSAQNRFQILDPNDNVLTDHCDHDLPLLNETAAEILASDLNGTAFYLNCSHVEMETRASLAYCFLSSLVHSLRNPPRLNFDIDEILEHERFIRVLRDPEHDRRMAEVFDQARLGLQALLGDLNELDATDQRIDRSIAAIVSRIREMTLHEALMLVLVDRHLDRFSIILVILWIDGDIDERLLLEAYWCAVRGADPRALSEEETNEFTFMLDRLSALERLRWQIDTADDPLPR